MARPTHSHLHYVSTRTVQLPKVCGSRALGRLPPRVCCRWRCCEPGEAGIADGDISEEIAHRLLRVALRAHYALRHEGSAHLVAKVELCLRHGSAGMRVGQHLRVEARSRAIGEKEGTREDTRETRGDTVKAEESRGERRRAPVLFSTLRVRLRHLRTGGTSSGSVGFFEITPVSCGRSIYLCRENGARVRARRHGGICETHTARLRRATTSQSETKARARRRNASSLAARDMNARCECEVTWQVCRAGSGKQASAGRTAHSCSVAIWSMPIALRRLSSVSAGSMHHS